MLRKRQYDVRNGEWDLGNIHIRGLEERCMLSCIYRTGTIVEERRPYLCCCKGPQNEHDAEAKLALSYERVMMNLT